MPRSYCLLPLLQAQALGLINVLERYALADARHTRGYAVDETFSSQSARPGQPDHYPKTWPKHFVEARFGEAALTQAAAAAAAAARPHDAYTGT